MAHAPPVVQRSAGARRNAARRLGARFVRAARREPEAKSQRKNAPRGWSGRGVNAPRAALRLALRVLHGASLQAAAARGVDGSAASTHVRCVRCAVSLRSGPLRQ
jgi:hypothetical protein